jgi:hypothetical protein
MKFLCEIFILNWALWSQNIILNSLILKFKIFKQSDVDVVYIKVVVLNTIYNFVVEFILFEVV